MIADVMKEYKKKKLNFLVNSKIPEEKIDLISNWFYVSKVV